MVGVRVEVLGIKDLTAYFQRLAREASNGKLTASAVRDGAEVILEQARANIRSKLTERTGTLSESGAVVMVNQWRADVQFSAVYAAVHEYGLQEQPITDRQRRFFWAMFSETGEDMWKALALSRTYTIPARPYLRPAIDSHRGRAATAMGKALRHEIVQGRPKAATIRGGGALNY